MTDGEPPKATPSMRDVGVRVVTGVAMAVVALAVLWAGSLPFAVLVGAVAVVVSWEWGRIVRSAGVDAIFVIQAGAVIVAVLLASRGLAGLGLIAVLVAAILSSLLAFGERGHMAALGALYAGLPAVALVWLRGDMFGLLAVLFLLLAVWTTDTGAYFAGRRIGGPKLMPRISPNKTWSGLIGGIAAAGIVGLVFALLANAGLHPGRMTVSGMVLGLVAQAGDLLESGLKREYGVKDASNLIPGHGGFMDRIDGLAAAAVAAALFAMVVNIQAPARALLGLN